MAWHNTLLRNKEGHITDSLSSGQDITERRQAEAIQGEFVQSVLAAQEEERRRIPRELHGQTGQSLMSILVGLRRMEDSPTMEAAREVVESLRHMTSEAMKEVVRLAQGLRPAILDDMGLEAALERHASDFAHTHKIDVTIDTIGAQEERLSPNIEVAFFRIAQEALTNIAKPARAMQSVSYLTVMARMYNSLSKTMVSDFSLLPEKALALLQGYA